MFCFQLYAASEEETQTQNDESEAEVSIGTEIPDHEPMDEYQSPDMLLDLNQTMEEEPSTSLIRFHVQDDSGKPLLLIFLLP